MTVIGPGVTPDVQRVGRSLAAYDAARDATLDKLFDELVGSSDGVCTKER